MDWKEQTVLVTGGTGSFGRKCVEILLQEYHPKRLVIFSRDELKQSEMQRDLSDSSLRFFIGDVRDRERLYRAFHEVDVIIHAAALKQVPSCEYNPFEAVKTNILGGQNVIDAAIDCGVRRVMDISTDKAVSPVNLYGATKLVAEKIFVQANAYAGFRPTRFACVRYGNVVGSRGSVIPLFLEQRNHGRITVTDPSMTRFWITVEQGVRFVLRCIEQMHGGEVFVPKIPSASVVDLARAVAPDCKVEHIGVWPGEKIHEILVSPDESHLTLELDDMFIVQPAYPWWGKGNWENQGRPVPRGFSYASNSNPHRLTQQELSEILEGL